jgi:hypothetical protein
MTDVSENEGFVVGRGSTMIWRAMMSIRSTSTAAGSSWRSRRSVTT